MVTPGLDDEDEKDDNGPRRVSTTIVDQVTTRTIFNNQPVEESLAEGTTLRAVVLEVEVPPQAAGWMTMTTNPGTPDIT